MSKISSQNVSSHTCWCVFGHWAFVKTTLRGTQKWNHFNSLHFLWLKNESIDRQYIIIKRWNSKISALKEDQALPIAFIWHGPSGSITIYTLGKGPWQIFCGGSSCQARRSQTLFIKLLPHWLGNYTNWEYFYAPLPCTSTFCAWTLVPFYLNADIAHLPLSTAAARGFLVPKAPFCLLLEASVLPVFMKARAWSLTQAVNPGWEILFGSKHIPFFFTCSFLSRHVSKEYS